MSMIEEGCDVVAEWTVLKMGGGMGLALDVQLMKVRHLTSGKTP